VLRTNGRRVRGAGPVPGRDHRGVRDRPGGQDAGGADRAPDRSRSGRVVRVPPRGRDRAHPRLRARRGRTGVALDAATSRRVHGGRHRGRRAAPRRHRPPDQPRPGPRRRRRGTAQAGAGRPDRRRRTARSVPHRRRLRGRRTGRHRGRSRLRRPRGRGRLGYLYRGDHDADVTLQSPEQLASLVDPSVAER
jgi:hypothetical protein